MPLEPTALEQFCTDIEKALSGMRRENNDAHNRIFDLMETQQGEINAMKIDFAKVKERTTLLGLIGSAIGGLVGGVFGGKI